MPEGPEVRRCAELIGSVLKNGTLTAITPVSGKLQHLGIPGLDSFTPGDVISTTVKGKVIFIKLSTGKTIISTLGMSGWWYPSRVSNELAYQKAHYNNSEVLIKDVIGQAMKYTRVELSSSEGDVLYSDMRNFGNLSVVSHDEASLKHAALGPDLLNEDVTYELWRERWRLKKVQKQPIAAALLDQSIVCGLGNIYRAETCYLAEVNPFTEVQALTDEQHARLLQAARYVLQVGYDVGVDRSGNVGYRISKLRKIFSPERFAKIKAEVVRTLPPIGWDGIEAYGVYGALLVMGNRRSIAGEPVTRTSVGGRTLWHVVD